MLQKDTKVVVIPTYAACMDFAVGKIGFITNYDIPTYTACMDFAVGKIGFITNYDKDNEMYGVWFDGPPWPKVISGNSWNEFFDFQLIEI